VQADVQEVASKLSSSRCILPAHQLQLIEEFRTLVRTLAQSVLSCSRLTLNHSLQIRCSLARSAAEMQHIRLCAGR
jgi:hypothetical protein